MAATPTRRAARHAVRRLKRFHPTRTRCAAAAAVTGALCLIEWTAGLRPAAPTHGEAAAIRHAARRLMFGGFVDPAQLEDRPAGWLAGRLLPRREVRRRAARALADRALADGPFAATNHSAVPGRLDSTAADGAEWWLPQQGVDPWLPRLGPVGSAAQALGLQSFYSRWIVADLSVWGETGISAVRPSRCAHHCRANCSFPLQDRVPTSTAASMAAA